MSKEPNSAQKTKQDEYSLLNAQERHEVMRLLQAQNPNPKSELNYSNNFELLCAVVLSAQATDVSVNLATPALFAAAKDAKSMAALGADGIAPFIKSIGLWKNKAKNLAALAKILDEKYQGQVPSTYDELIALPGVGSKTARVVLNVAFDQPYIAVDTHVFRVCNRIGYCLGKSPQEVEERLPPLVEDEFLKDAHHYFLLHGRYNCTAKNFKKHCEQCVVRDFCKHNYELKDADSSKKSSASKSTAKSSAKKTTTSKSSTTKKSTTKKVSKTTTTKKTTANKTVSKKQPKKDE